MKKTLMVLMIFLCLNLFLGADEGMWLLTQIKNLNLQKNGLKIDPSDIYSPYKPSIANAVVLLSGGTAEFVSSQGLLLTNHHVAFRAVQRASTKGTDYLTNGFLAKTNEEEIEAPGYSAYILQSIKDVTERIAKAGRKIKDPVKREKAINRAIKKMTDKIEKGKKDISASIAKMYNGKQYVLSIYKRFDDIRVVYMPPKAIGYYGGEIDNWMWPRHTGDFAFMRVYMAPDGTGRKYNKENIPYKPKFWLKISTGNLKDGDLTFILGYPGRTNRYRTSNSVGFNLKYHYPKYVKTFKEIITLMEKAGKDSPKAKMKVSGLIQGLSNSKKNYQGNIDCMNRTSFLQKKIMFERDLETFLKKDPDLYRKYGDILDKIKNEYDLLNKTREYDKLLGLFGRLSGTMTGIAQKIYSTVKERAKPKKERNPYFSEKDIKRSVNRLHFSYMSFYEPADKVLLKRTLEIAAKLPKDSRIKGLEYIFTDQAKTIDQFIEETYRKTHLKDASFVKLLFYKSVDELEALNDPFINLAKNLYQENETLRKRNEKFNAKITELRKSYIDALYAWKGTGLYPDANRTMRFSYGVVAGYKPKDAVSYKPITTLKGVLEKDTGKEPFNVPEALKTLYKNKDFGRWTDPTLKDVPVAFTHKVDSTGGNSGSPVLNAKGELVGILFDGNYEAMTSDWQYDDAVQRSISVDIRYVMFITEKLGNAKNILKEMGIK